MSKLALDTRNEIHSKGSIMKYINRYSISGVIIVGFLFSLPVVLALDTLPKFKEIVADDNKTSVQKVSLAKGAYAETFSEFKKSFVDLHGVVTKAQGQDIITVDNKTYVRDSKGQVHRVMAKGNINVKPKVDKIVDAVKYAEDRNAKTMFVMVPSNVIDGVTKLPPGIEDYQNYYLDAVMDQLNQNGVYSMNLQDLLPDAGVDMSDVFFNTDHHWKIPYAFTSKNLIVDSLNSKYNLGIDPDGFYADLNNYTVKTYENSYAGSYTTAAGEAFAGSSDDFTSILPKFDTEFRFRGYVSSGKLKFDKTLEKPCDLTGPFQEALFDQTFIYKDSPKSYQAYLRSVVTESIIENKKAPNDLKILLIGTSHARAVVPFLSLPVKDLAFLDLQDDKFEGNAYEYIDNYKPDVVLFMYSPISFEKNDLFNFDK